MSIFERLQEELEGLEDKEKHKGYWYGISDALLVLVCGMLCGLQRIDDIHDWARSKPTRQFLEKEFGMEKIFCRAQFYNLLGYVDAEKFRISFSSWMQSIVNSKKEKRTIAIDGKTVCSTDKLRDDGSVLHIASAIISELNLVIGHQPCDTKMGEITAFRDLVELLDVSGSIVVADALHCNQKSCEAVVKESADYLFVVKDNQRNLRDDIEYYIQNEEIRSFQTIERNGGRIEKRTAYVTSNISWLNDKDRFKNLQIIGAIHREFEKGDHKTSEWHYYISSANLTPKQLLKHARLEWAVESMHWLLDVHFNEDKTAVWDMNVQQLLNTTRKIALNLVRIFKNQCAPKKALSRIMRENLFDLEQLASFLHLFLTDFKLD